MSTVQEWRRSVATFMRIETPEPIQNPSDPPDFYFEMPHGSVAVELTQVVDPDHKARAGRGAPPYRGKLFEESQWSAERRAKKIRSIVGRKGEAYQRRGIFVDVLVIFTGEPWLRSVDVEQWLGDLWFDAHPNFGTTSLLLDYEPGRREQAWPVFPIYGDLQSVFARG